MVSTGLPPAESRLAPVASQCREPKAEGARHQPRGRPPASPGVSGRADGKFLPQDHWPLSASPSVLGTTVLLVAMTHGFVQRSQEP